MKKSKVRKRKVVKIVVAPSEFLCTPSRKVTEADYPMLPGLMCDMRGALLNSERGVGLSANQVGVCLQVVAVTTFGPGPKPVHFLINPELVETSEEKVVSKEGCLSYPGMVRLVARHKFITVRFIDGDDMQVHEIPFEDPASVIIQHELNHLEGKCPLSMY